MRASVALFGGLAVIFIGAAGRTGGDEPARPKPPGPVASKGAAEFLDDPLPAGAVARMGSPRFRHAAISDFRFVSDGKSILTSGSDRVVRTWDAETGRVARTVSVQAKHSGRCRLSADGKLAAVYDRERISVCDAETGKVLADLAGPKSPPVALFTFSPDGKLLAVAGQDSRIKVWDWRAGTVRDLPLPVRDNGQDSTFHAHFSPDGKYFAGRGHFQLPLCVYDTSTWEEVRRVYCDAGASTFTPDGKRLIVSSLRNDKGDREAVLRIFETATGNELATYALGHENVYYALTVSPDGRVLGCGASDRSCLFDLTTGKVLHFLSGRPWALRFSPDSKTFAATANGTHLRFWDVATGKERHEQPGNFGETLATAVSPNGRLLAAADWMDQAVHVWDTASGRHARRLPFKEGSRYARDLAFSPDGGTLSAGQYYGQIQAWETATGKEVMARQLGDSGGQIRPTYYSTRVSSDARWAATIHQDSYTRKTELTIWDVPTGKPLRQWTYPGEYYGRAWSADSGTLVLTPDAGVTIIDVESGEQRGRITGYCETPRPPSCPRMADLWPCDSRARKESPRRSASMSRPLASGSSPRRSAGADMPSRATIRLCSSRTTRTCVPGTCRRARKRPAVACRSA
jgi:WD40 repeat protein